MVSTEVKAQARWRAFLRRRFEGPETALQRLCDAIVGVGAPVFCVLFDPVVFRNTLGFSFLGEYTLIAYPLIGVEVVGLSLWLLCGRSCRPIAAALFVGTLAMGMLGALLLGLVIFPLSLIGLLVGGLGLLGFVPFLTAFVFLRNTIIAWRGARQTIRPGRIIVLTAVGCVLPLAMGGGPGVLAHKKVSRAITSIVEGEGASLRDSVQTLKFFRPWVSARLDKLALAYDRAAGMAQKSRIATAYQEITGEPIENRLASLKD